MKLQVRRQQRAIFQPFSERSDFLRSPGMSAAQPASSPMFILSESNVSGMTLSDGCSIEIKRLV